MLTAERNVKFHSSQTALGQFTAESAIQNEDHHDAIKLTSLLRSKYPFFNFIFSILCFDFFYSS